MKLCIAFATFALASVSIATPTPTVPINGRQLAGLPLSGLCIVDGGLSDVDSLLCAAGQVCTPIDLSSLLPLSLPALPAPTLPVVLGVSVPYLILYQQSERCIHRPANKASKAFASMQTFSNNTLSLSSPCSLLLISICEKTTHDTSAYLRKYLCP